MTSLFFRVIHSIFPVVPAAIRDEFTILTATQMQRQARLLNLALAITVPTAIYAASAEAPPFVQYGLPAIMGFACLLGAASFFRDLKLQNSVRRSAKLIRQCTSFSGTMAVVCSSWCVISWLTASDIHKVYYPLILSMGSLATAYCLASSRRAAILNLVIGILPISFLLLISGNRMDLAAGMSLIIATGFLLRMVFQQHAQLVDLLELKRQMRELADTDPLTGLLNRRAFAEKVDQEVKAAKGDGQFAFGLLDLDGFKPVNDRLGHAAGDELIQSIATRLQNAFGADGMVARLGGDEFGILVPATSSLFGAVGDHALAALATPHKVAGRAVQVGASIGIAHYPADGAQMQALFETADRALYAVKAERVQIRRAERLFQGVDVAA